MENKNVNNEEKEFEDIDAIEQILDENNEDNVILYDENDNPNEFEQCGVIQLDNTIYAILKPAFEIEGMADDEVLIFEIIEDDNGDMLSVVTDEKIINEVMKNLNDLIDEEIKKEEESKKNSEKKDK